MQTDRKDIIQFNLILNIIFIFYVFRIKYLHFNMLNLKPLNIALQSYSAVILSYIYSYRI